MTIRRPYLAVRRFETESELRTWHAAWRRRASEALDGFVSPVEGPLSPSLRERLLAEGQFICATPHGDIEIWDLDVEHLVDAVNVDGVVEIRLTTRTAWSAWRGTMLHDVVAW